MYLDVSACLAETGFPRRPTPPVHNMEDVLEVYQRDDRRPVVCVDETSKQLVSETRVPLPPAPGHPLRRRNGVCNLLAAPQQGWRTVKVTARRTKLDFAAVLRDLVDVHFPDLLRQPQHAPPPCAVRGLPAGRGPAHLEWHYTPKHGSWLNIAEIEFAALAAQCLDRRIASEAELRAESRPGCAPAMEDAMRSYIESRTQGRVRPEVMAHFRASLERNRRLGELLADS